MSEKTDAAKVSPGDQQVTTLLGQGSEFSGKLTFEGTVRIDGRFSGEIFSEGTLVVGEGARISADIAVTRLLVQGRVEGNLTAREAIELHQPARVKGKLVTPELEIQRGVRFDGSCEMSDASASSAPADKPSAGEPSADEPS